VLLDISVLYVVHAHRPGVLSDRSVRAPNGSLICLAYMYVCTNGI